MATTANAPIAEASYKLRQFPLNVKAKPIPGIIISRKELERILEFHEPYWEYRRASNILHALRLWGSQAIFPAKALFKVPAGVYAAPGSEMLSFFLDESIFRRRYANALPYFFRSSYGVGARQDIDSSANNHRDDFLALAAEIGLSTATRFRWAGQEFTLDQLFPHSFQWYHPDQEIEFTAVAYAQYLRPGSFWINRFGEHFTLDGIADALINKALTKASCYGTHIPYALAAILAVDEQEHILSNRYREGAKLRLRKFSKDLTAYQGAAGWWDRKWTKPLVASYPFEPEDLEWIRSTAHHLEWIALVNADLRPPLKNVQRAVDFLIKFLRSRNSGGLSAATHFDVCSHACRALVLLSGNYYASEVMAENWKRRDREIALPVGNSNKTLPNR